MKSEAPLPASRKRKGASAHAPENPSTVGAVSNDGGTVATNFTREIGPALSAAAASHTNPVDKEPLKTIVQLDKESRARNE